MCVGRERESARLSWRRVRVSQVCRRGFEPCDLLALPSQQSKTCHNFQRFSLLAEVIECLASDLRSSRNLHKLQLLDCMRTKLLQCPQGGPFSKVNAALSSRTTFFHNMPANLNRNGWTNLHYAVARNDLFMINNLLKSKANVNAKTRGADKDFFLRPALSPLHVWPLGSN